MEAGQCEHSGRGKLPYFGAAGYSPSTLMPLFGFLLHFEGLKTKLAQHALRLPEVNPRDTC